MDQKNKQQPSAPDKKIPASVMIIGTYEIAVSLFFMMLLFLVAPLDRTSAAVLLFLIIYGAIGTGLLAIQEWARRANVILHTLALPFTVFIAIFVDDSPNWPIVAVQLLIALAIVRALTRPAIQHKFQTAVPRSKS